MSNTTSCLPPAQADASTCGEDLNDALAECGLAVRPEEVTARVLSMPPKEMFDPPVGNSYVLAKGKAKLADVLSQSYCLTDLSLDDILSTQGRKTSRPLMDFDDVKSAPAEVPIVSWDDDDDPEWNADRSEIMDAVQSFYGHPDGNS